MDAAEEISRIMLRIRSFKTKFTIFKSYRRYRNLTHIDVHLISSQEAPLPKILQPIKLADDAEEMWHIISLRLYL